MSKIQMAAMLILAVAMGTVLTTSELHRYPATKVVPMPSDGSASPLPAPIVVGPRRIP
jgi:hypothetical protein